MLSNAFQKIISGEIKHVEQQERRERGQPLGFTGKKFRVLSELPENLVSYKTSTSDDVRELASGREPDDLQQKLKMVVSNPKHVKLLNLVWIDSMSTKEAAVRLSLDYDNARTIVFRAKKKWTKLFGTKIGD